MACVVRVRSEREGQQQGREIFWGTAPRSPDLDGKGFPLSGLRLNDRVLVEPPEVYRSAYPA